MSHQFRDLVLGAGFGVLLLAALVPTMTPLLADIEGYLFPVVRDVEILDVEEVPGGLSIQITFNKVRDCPEFIGVAWYVVDTSEVTRRAVLQFPSSDDDSDQGRTQGVHVDDGWLLGMTLDDLPRSYAVARHQCHVLWPTTTHFYPPT